MFKQDVIAIINQMNRNDNLAQGAIQQVTNGLYRSVELLVLIGNDIDKTNSYTSAISAVEKTWVSNEGFCQSAPQQAANGAYRVAELLEILIQILDKDGIYKIAAANVMATLERNELLCQSAPQQIANGAYRIAELLQILTNVLTTGRSNQLEQMIESMNRMDNLCQGAPQQTANATDTAAGIVELLVQDLDKHQKYSSQLSLIVSLKTRNNSLCQGADQQSANYIYRMVEMVQIITEIMDDEKILETKRYWEAHTEEKTALLQEKARNQAEIQKIEKEAGAVNAREELDGIKGQIREMEAECREIGRQELQKLEGAYNAANNELSSIGFFKFSERKLAKVKLAEALLALNNKKQEVEALQRGIKDKIAGKRREIEKIERRVKEEKEKILSRKTPFENRIDQIEYELTCERSCE